MLFYPEGEGDHIFSSFDLTVPVNVAIIKLDDPINLFLHYLFAG